MPKPTYAEIASAAKVGTATVERVLNGRGGVRRETAARVLIAARDLDWGGRLPDLHRGIVRIEVLLVRPDTSFFDRLARAFRRMAASLDRMIQVHVTFIEETAPTRIANHIADRTLRRSGLIVSAPAHRAVRDALSEARSGGLPIVQIVTRNIPDAPYVGIDNYAAGRMAGLMMARLGAVDGTVVAMSHGQAYQVHGERLRGFSDYLAENPREGLAFDYIGFHGDDRSANADLTHALLRDRPDLAGIYNCGGGNAGLLEALRRSGRHPFVVLHEQTEATTAALKDGIASIVFDQLPEAQARRALDLMLARLGMIAGPVENPPIRFTTLTRENV